MSEGPRIPSPSAAATTPAPAGDTATGPVPGGLPPAPGPTAAGPATDTLQELTPGSDSPADGHQPTAPVTTRPRVRPGRTQPLIRMGPWAPVAGAFAGLIGGLVVVLLLAGVADAFDERLALVFLTVGLGMLGAAGPLLADEVGLVRRRAREAAARPAWAETTAGLLNGLTPARLLLVSSAFVLFLSAYVVEG